MEIWIALNKKYNLCHIDLKFCKQIQEFKIYLEFKIIMVLKLSILNLYFHDD